MFDTATYVILGVLLVPFILCIILIFLILSQRKRLDQKNEQIYQSRDFLIDKYFKGDYKAVEPSSKQFLLKEFYKIEDQVSFSPNMRKQIIEDFTDLDLFTKYLKNLNSHSRHKRMLAAHYLGIFEFDTVAEALTTRLNKEKDESVKFYIIYSLIKYVHKDSFMSIIESLIGSSLRYQEKVATIIINNFSHNNTYLFNLEDRKEIEIVTFLLKVSKYHVNTFLNGYVRKFYIENKDQISHAISNNKQEEVMYRYALLACINVDDTMVDKFELIADQNEEVRNVASDILRKSNSFDDILSLLEVKVTVENQDLITDTILSIANNESEHAISLLRLYRREKNQQKKDIIATVLSSRTDYILYKIVGEDEAVITKLTYHILKLGRTASIIDFLNNNVDEDIETKILSIVSNVIKENSQFETEVRIYLKEKLCKKIGLEKLKAFQKKRPKPKFELRKVVWMLSILFITILIYPAFFVIKNFGILDTLSLQEMFYQLILDINYNLIFYFFFLNAIYISFVIISFYTTKKQMELWEIKSETLLFENRLLPGISVIAPAYNEEISIIESTKSLLNLKYPNYNVIVVNDGSSDKTLQTLINFFELDRKNPFYHQRLATKDIRGVYTNQQFPNLIVIDKDNGGKADALNVGINFSNKRFICGIDADSLLEIDSLLRAMSVTLDFNEPHIAIGGQILPVNGCTTDHGKIETYGLGKKAVVKYQTLEYMRAFNTGRIGWTEINSLLLISGAFGIFDKDKIIEVGGYISSSGIYQKDSVGEDMELVVRLTENSLRKKEKFRVNYVYHALCYTELPDNMGVLLKQRNRWHRGLIDILSFHRKMTFNPRYKQPGMIGMPYYVFFEMIGPFLETIGYVMLILGLVFGLLSLGVVAAIFSVTIMFGMLLSLASLFLSERKNAYSNRKITLQLLLYAIIENIGYRQLVSIHRVLSFFSALKDSGKWGIQKRKGFNK